MAQAPPSGNYYHHPQHRSLTPSYYASNGGGHYLAGPQQQQQPQRIMSMYSSTASTHGSYYAPQYSGTPNVKYQLAQQPQYVPQQGYNYRPQSTFYVGQQPLDDAYSTNSFSTSKGSTLSASTPSLSSMQNTTPFSKQRSRSYSTTSSAQLNSSAMSTHSTTQPSLVVAPAPDRYHRRKSMISLSSAAPQHNTSFNHAHSQSASSTNTSNTPTSTVSSASASTSSSSAMSNPSPSTIATNTPLSSSTSSIPNSPLLTETSISKPQPEPLIYKQPITHNGSVSAFSSSSSSKKDYSSLSSVSSLGSDVPTSTRKHPKPFIASSVTPAPSLPPPLVLPSDIRRNSLAHGGRSRSTSSSPAPSAPSKLPAAGPAKPLYNPYTSLSVSNSPQHKISVKASFQEYSAPKSNTNMAPRSKSMTSSSMGMRSSFAQQQQPQQQPSQPMPKPAKSTIPTAPPAKVSFGQKLRKAFSFTKKPADPKTGKSERTFSLSFSRKSRASTMNASVAQPSFNPKNDATRAMTMSTMTHPNIAPSSTRRTSTMTSSGAPPTFEGFDSVFVQNTQKRKSSRVKSHIEDDAHSIRSNSSISSFATLKKMGTSFSKGTKSLFNKNHASHNSVTPSDFVKPTQNATPTIPTPTLTRTPSQDRPQSYGSAALPVTPPASEPDLPLSFASLTHDLNVAAATGMAPTPPRTDTDSISTDVASTIKVAYNSPEDALPLPASEDESEEDLNVADTVFPKNLDPLTVETIRSSLDRTKSLERRRSRKSNRSVHSHSSNSELRSTPSGTLEVHVAPEDAPINSPPSPGASPHGILKTPSQLDTDTSLDLPIEKPEIAPARNRNSLKPSPSISSIFDFGDIDLDLNFDFAPAAAAGLETEAKKYKSSLKSKPKDYSLSNSQMQQSYHESYMDHKHTNSASQPYYHPLYQPPRENSWKSLHYEHKATNSTSSSTSALPGSVSFSSRIIIFDTYDAYDYDRRAEPATCNRLNPLLAQQIKEELNNFKMEMDVHAESRIYTHFY